MASKMEEQDILDSLDALDYPKNIKTEQDLEALVGGGLESAEFLELVSWLSSELKEIGGLEEMVHPVTNNDTNSFLLELSSFLKELNCPHPSLIEGPVSGRLETKQQRLQLLDFLCTELQATKLIAVQELQEMQKNRAAPKEMEESEASAYLRKMLQSLGFPKPPDSITEAQLFAKVIDKVNAQMEKVPKDHLGKPLFTGVLSDKQWAALSRVNEAMRQEYSMRAETLLKRLDVTIQSFTWSDRVKKMEDALVKAYRPYRAQMRPQSQVGIPDLLAARNDLILVEKTSSSTVRKNTQSKINKVMMKARPPDRGGRPGELEAPPPEMPAWQKDRAPAPSGGRGGGRGGGRVQGGWSGGGGRNFQGDGYQQPQHGYAGFQPQYQDRGYQQQDRGYQQQDRGYQQQGGGYQQQGGGYQQQGSGYQKPYQQQTQYYQQPQDFGHQNQRGGGGGGGGGYRGGRGGARGGRRY